ncbi:MAG: ATP-dependent zinc metalloprotease FtsH [Thermoguttaceae bacterium]|jgi:cell division protease FtsH
MAGPAEPPKQPEPSPSKGHRRPRRPWLSTFPWWYIPLVLLVLWVWQDFLLNAPVQTISYSDFKHYLAEGEVGEVAIHESEITGQIVPKGSGQNEVGSGRKAAGGGETAAKAEGPVKTAEAAKAPTEAKKTPAAHNAAPATAEKVPTGQPATAKPDEKPPEKPFAFRTVCGSQGTDPKLVEELERQGVQFSFARASLLAQFLLAWILPLGLVFVLWVLLSRGLRNAGQAVMSFGRSKARVSSDRDTGVTFGDVAGCDEAKYELQEVVDFLKNPGRYTALGAKIPKGVLLVGLPGTGKTLLSRAVAGEAGVPFFSLSGSEFVEMFVGVGAARVRDLFQQAKAQAPAIIFIDELDAIGRERSVHVGPVNDEREQTLNQLLVEMDGFEANVGVIILAATNRPEVLDRALLRPGRFDRQVVIDAPDLEGRAAILQVHARDKPLAPGVDLRRIARGTPGFSGADLANTLNEAALGAARRKAESITQENLEEAVEKVMAGPERRSRRLVEEEKRRVACHETGHALVATFSRHADQVHKISIVPRGRAALGYTLQLPEFEQFLQTRSDLVDRIKAMLGGRAAEEVVFHEVSTGAENDLDRATAVARQMVAVYGMSDKVGLIHVGRRFDHPGSVLPDGQGNLDCSSELADQVDREVKHLLESAYEEAKGILLAHRTELDTVAAALVERESLDKAEFLRLLGMAEVAG